MIKWDLICSVLFVTLFCTYRFVCDLVFALCSFSNVQNWNKNPSNYAAAPHIIYWRTECLSCANLFALIFISRNRNKQIFSASDYVLFNTLFESYSVWSEIEWFHLLWIWAIVIVQLNWIAFKMTAKLIVFSSKLHRSLNHTEQQVQSEHKNNNHANGNREEKTSTKRTHDTLKTAHLELKFELGKKSNY